MQGHEMQHISYQMISLASKLALCSFVSSFGGWLWHVNTWTSQDLHCGYCEQANVHSCVIFIISKL